MMRANSSRAFFQHGIVGISLALITGCSSMRLTTTLPPSDNRELSFGDIRMKIATVFSPVGRFSCEEMMTIAQQQYPRIFSTDRDALPVDVGISGQYSQEMNGNVCLILLFGWGTLPSPQTFYEGTYDVRVSSADEDQGLILDQSIHFERRDAGWSSWYTPLGLIPAPGHSDLSRVYTVGFDTTDAAAKSRWLDHASCVEAIVKAAKKGDLARMRVASGFAARRYETFSVGGQTVWCKRVPKSSKAPVGVAPDMVLGEIYLEEPDVNAQPAEVVQIARRSGEGNWQATPQVLWRTRTLCQATAVIENGKPVHAQVTEIRNPPLADFLDSARPPAPDPATAMEYFRWRTGVLLQAKNETLPRVLKESPTADLVALVTRTEKAVLDFSHMADQAKNQAQEALEKGTDIGSNREWSSLYNERVAVLTTILTALKEELANRQR